MREGAFPDPSEAIDDGGRSKARVLTIRPEPDRVVSAPALAARQTVEALGLAADVEPALADMNWGAWRGRSLEDLHTAEPEALMTWMRDPPSGAPGGGTFAEVTRRVGAWMAEQAAGEGRVLAITHPNVIRAALAHALDLPAEAAFRIDIAPLTAVTLSFNRVWRLQGLAVDGGEV
jgi:broad specificity phosphatase PhoE